MEMGNLTRMSYTGLEVGIHPDKSDIKKYSNTSIEVATDR